MEKLEIKLKKCCLTCEHFYMDAAKIGIGCCSPAPRELSCLHMPVCWKYMIDDAQEHQDPVGEPGQMGNPE